MLPGPARSSSFRVGDAYPPSELKHLISSSSTAASTGLRRTKQSGTAAFSGSISASPVTNTIIVFGQRCAKLLAEVVAAAVRHPDVQQRDIDVAGLQMRLGRLAAVVSGHFKARAAQQRAEQLAAVVMVFDDRRTHLPVGMGSPAPLKKDQANRDHPGGRMKR